MQDGVFWNFGGQAQVAVPDTQLPQTLSVKHPESRLVLRAQLLHPSAFLSSSSSPVSRAISRTLIPAPFLENAPCGVGAWRPLEMGRWGWGELGRGPLLNL